MLRKYYIIYYNFTIFISTSQVKFVNYANKNNMIYFVLLLITILYIRNKIIVYFISTNILRDQKMFWNKCKVKCFTVLKIRV